MTTLLSNIIYVLNALFNFCRSHKPSFLCLAEPKVAFDSILGSYWRSLNLSFVASNDLDFPSPWVLVSNDVGAGNVNVFSSSAQHVTMECKFNMQSQFLTCVYAHVLCFMRSIYGLSWSIFPL